MLRSAYRALRSKYWRFSDMVPPVGRDPRDPWKNYRYIDTVKHSDKLKIGNQYRPFTLQCETVNACNNLCIICAYPLQERKKVLMPMPLFEKTLQDYSEMGGGYLSLTPVTGDILLDKHLLERFDMIKGYPAITEVGVTTNAAMLDRFSDDDVVTIVNSLARIQISIYGIDKEEYIAMTKRDTYERTIDGIRRILAVRTNRVSLGFRMLKPRSQKEVEDWVANVVGCKEPVEINSIKIGDYSNFTKLDTSKPLPFGATWKVTPSNKGQCLIPLLAVQVSSNGDVAFCSCVGNQEGLVLGNIKMNTLMDIYNSPKTRAMWNWSQSTIPKACKTCTFYTPLETLRTDPSIFEDPFPLIGA